MSTLDYQSGLGAGYAVARRVKNNLNSWAQHAEKLQARVQELEAENEKLRRMVIVSHATKQATEHLRDELAQVVERVAPTAALADPMARQAITHNRLVVLLEKAGYAYDPEKGTLIPVHNGPSMGW